jgi:hypothetical protein
MFEKGLETFLSSIPVAYAIILSFGIVITYAIYKLIMTKQEDKKNLLRFWWLFALVAIATIASLLFYNWWLNRPLPWSPNAQLRVIVCGFSKTSEGRNVSEGLLADLSRLLDSIGLNRAVEIRTYLDATPTQNADVVKLAAKSGANAVVWGYIVHQKTGQSLAYPSVTCLNPEFCRVYRSDRPIVINLGNIKQTSSPTMQLALAVFEQSPLYKGSSFQEVFNLRNDKNSAVDIPSPEPGKPVSINLIIYVDESISSSSVEPGHVIKYALFVKNNSDRTIKDLKAVNKISKIEKYLHGSAALNGDKLIEEKNSVEITANQIEFTIGSLEAQERALLTYWVMVQ